ncbi:MAG: hypothetical protein WAQ57_00090 [Candidatus Saccharimonadales bacterium]
MKYFDWDQLKNLKLKAERSVSFEDILTAIEEGRILANSMHPNKARYQNQRVLVVEVEDYAYLVPYVEDGEKIFLKTIIPSRRSTKKYLRGENQ